MTRNRKKPVAEIAAPQLAPPQTAGSQKEDAVAANTAGVESSLPLQVEAQERTIRCVICSTATQAGSPDHMCWVCRRLKISAWREVEQQMPAQE